MIAIVLGTRPEIIKMGPVIKECEERGLDYFFILHIVRSVRKIHN